MINDAVGDEHSDPALMEFLGAEMKKESGQFFKVGSKRTEIQLSAIICSFSKLTKKGREKSMFDIFPGLGDPSAAKAGS